MPNSKLTALFCSLFLVLPILQPLEDVVVWKNSKKLDTQEIQYTISIKKENMDLYRSYPILRDRFSNKTQLTSFTRTPSAFYIGHQRYAGYPLPEEYSSVSQLEWETKGSSRFRYSQYHFIAEPDMGVNFRSDLLHLPETTLYWEQDYRYGAVMPSADIVKSKQYLFSPTMDGRLTALSTLTGNAYWEIQLPLGEIIEQALASFVLQDQLIIAAGSNQGNLYLFSGENGSQLQKIFLGKALTAPLYYFAFEKEAGIIAVTSDAIVCYDLVSRAIRWQIVNTMQISHSPFTLMAGSQLYIILASMNGIIQAVDLDGRNQWQRSLYASINYPPVGFVYQGTPYIAGATASNNAFLLNGLNGAVRFSKPLPGKPRSHLSVDAASFSYALFTADPSGDENSIFFNDHFMTEERIRGHISMKGRRFLGPIGVRVDSETFYYVVDQEWQVWMLQKGSNHVLRGHQPFALSVSQGAYYPHLDGGIILTDYALFVACPGKGLFAMGQPQDNVWDRSFHQLGTHLLSHTHYRNDLDQWPSTADISALPYSIPLGDSSRPIPSPGVFFSRDYRKLFAIVSDNQGNIQLINTRGKLAFNFAIQAGKIYVPPLFEQFREQGVKIYILSENSVQSWIWDLKHQRIEKLWERRDLGSKGSTFMKVEQFQGHRLFFVDERAYLTSLCTDTGETIFRQRVDAWQFAYYVLHTQPFIFCGSKKMDALFGKVISKVFVSKSQSSVLGFAGRVYLFQSDDLDLIAWDAYSGDILWRVRRLWCRNYCYQQTAPAVLNKAYHAWAYVSDYNRLLCIDVLSGFIWWRKAFRDDYLMTAPVIAESQYQPAVFLGTVYGNLYAFNAKNGIELGSYPVTMPGKSSDKEELKGCSSPVIVNGCIFINRLEYGLCILGQEKENNRDFPLFVFNVSRNKAIFSLPVFNRAELQWEGKTVYSNVTQD